MQVLHAIYGCIGYALKWCKLYSEDSSIKSFKINPYDRYVAKQMSNVKQFTIVWYVDDNKLSHMEK